MKLKQLLTLKDTIYEEDGRWSQSVRLVQRETSVQR